MDYLVGYELLSVAIIKQAVSDYERAYKKFLKKQDAAAFETMKEIEGFFLSDYFGTISNIDGKNFFYKFKESLEKKNVSEPKKAA